MNIIDTRDLNKDIECKFNYIMNDLYGLGYSNKLIWIG